MKILPITQFKITTPSGIPVSGEYEGNLDNGRVVVFVHGFGVKRDSRGMFIDISNVLSDKFLIIRYDSFLMEENDVTKRKVLEYSKQAEMLTAVLEYISMEFRPVHVYIIAHSMGDAVVSVTDLPHANRIILLAPSPPKTDETIKNYHKNRKHSHINENGKSVLSHSDGTQSVVDTKFWQEMKNIDQFNLYKKLARKRSFLCVL